MRDVNENGKFNVQTELLPFFAQNKDGKPKFLSYLAKYMGVAEKDILSFELAPYEALDGALLARTRSLSPSQGLTTPLCPTT